MPLIKRHDPSPTRRVYLTVVTTEIETEPFERGDDPSWQDHVATYLGGVILEGMMKEDSRDDVLDLRSYALGVCIGRDNASHAPVLEVHTEREPGVVYWCKTCGAFKYGRDGEWELPEIRIDRKEK